MIRFDCPNPALLVHAARAIRTCLHPRQDRGELRAMTPMPLGYFTPKEGSASQRGRHEGPGHLGQVGRGAAATGYGLRRRGAGAEGAAVQRRADPAGRAAPARGPGDRARRRRRPRGPRRVHDLADVPERRAAAAWTCSTSRSPHYMAAVEQRLSMGDVTPRGYEVKVNLDGFLRGGHEDADGGLRDRQAARAYPPERSGGARGHPEASSKPKPVLPNASSAGDDAARPDGGR